MSSTPSVDDEQDVVPEKARVWRVYNMEREVLIAEKPPATSPGRGSCCVCVCVSLGAGCFVSSSCSCSWEQRIGAIQINLFHIFLLFRSIFRNLVILHVSPV